MEFATLPIFRVMGISQTVVRTDAITTAQQLQQQWLASPPHMAGFSQTLYCVYQYLHTWRDSAKLCIVFTNILMKIK